MMNLIRIAYQFQQISISFHRVAFPSFGQFLYLNYDDDSTALPFILFCTHREIGWTTADIELVPLLLNIFIISSSIVWLHSERELQKACCHILIEKRRPSIAGWMNESKIAELLSFCQHHTSDVFVFTVVPCHPTFCPLPSLCTLSSFGCLQTDRQRDVWDWWSCLAICYAKWSPNEIEISSFFSSLITYSYKTFICSLRLTLSGASFSLSPRRTGWTEWI